MTSLGALGRIGRAGFAAGAQAGGGPRYVPELLAFYPDRVTGEMLGIGTGVGSCSESRSSALLAPNDIGTYVSNPALAPAWRGASWGDGVAYGNAGGAGLGVSPYVQHAPSANNEARLVTFTATNATFTQDQIDIDGQALAYRVEDSLTNAAGAIYALSAIPAIAAEVHAVGYVRKWPRGVAAFGYQSYPTVALNVRLSDGVADWYGTPGTGYLVVDMGDWWKVIVSFNQTSAQRLYLHPAATAEDALTTRGSAPVNAAIFSRFSEAYLASTFTREQIAKLPPLLQAASADVSRPACVLSISDGNMQPSGTLYCEVNLVAPPSGSINILGSFLTWDGTTLTFTDGTTAQTVAMSAGAHAIAMQFDATGGIKNLYLDGTWGTETAYDGTIHTGALPIFNSAPCVQEMRYLTRYAEIGAEGRDAVAQSIYPLSIAVSTTDTVESVNDTAQFSAIGTYHGGGTADLTAQVTWSSGDATYATVNASGVATLVSTRQYGFAPIRASFTSLLRTVVGSAELRANAGTAAIYDQVDTVDAYGEPLSVYIPNANADNPYDPLTPTNLILYCHGAGELYDGVATDSKKATTVAALLNAGYLICASRAHQDNWGNQAGIDDNLHAYQYMAANYNIRDFCIWSASMGGATGLNAIAQNVLNPAGWLGTYPVCNLANMYAGAYKTAIDTAYGITGVSPNTYSEKTAGFDPVLRAAADFDTIPMRMYASTGDGTVSKAQNADLFRTLVWSTRLEAEVLPHTGGHADPSAFVPADYVAFFARCFGAD